MKRRDVLKGGGASLILLSCGRSELFRASEERPEEDEVPIQPVGIGYEAPVTVAGSVLLGKQSQATINPLALKHPDGQPMELYEVKFLVYATSTASVVGGAAIAASFMLDSYPITNGYVSLLCFGRGRHTQIEQPPTSFGGNPTYFMVYRWLFDAPLFVPGGSALVPTFESRGLVNDSFTVEVAMSGKTLRKGSRPKQIVYPYVSAYSTPPLDMTAASSDASPEQALSNATANMVNVHRLIGRLSIGPAEVIGGTGTSNKNDIANAMIRIRMATSSGVPMVRLRTPFSQVFDPATKSIETNHILHPKEFYKLYTDTTAPADASAVAAGTFAQAHVAVHGSIVVSQ